MTGQTITLEAYGCSLKNGVICDKIGQEVSFQDLKNLAKTLKQALVRCAQIHLGADISDVASYKDLEKTLNKAYDKQIEGFKKEFEEQQPEFDIIRAIVDARISQNLTQKELAEREEVATQNEVTGTNKDDFDF